LARPAGFEPTTPWFVGAKVEPRLPFNQDLASLAIAIA